MSFPRARIQRFNEFPNDAPPPGSYDPKFKNKVRGLVIEKTDRFQDSRSVSSSCADCNTSTSSKSASVTSIPSFKIPQLPKKKTTAKPANNLTPVKSTKKFDAKYDLTKELADLKVECTNKNRTIQEYEKQIEEMKEDILTLEKQLLELKTQQTEIEMRHQKDLDEMAQDRQLADIEMKTKIQKMHEDFQAEISIMKAEESKISEELSAIVEIRKDLDLKLQQRQHLVSQLQSQLSRLECELEECRTESENLAVESNRQATSQAIAHEAELQKLNKDFEREKDELLEQHAYDTNEKLRLQDSLQAESTVRKCLEDKLSKIQCLYSDVKNRLKEAEDELQEIQEHHSQVLKNHSQEIETLMTRHTEEVARLVQKSEEFRQECAAERQKREDIEKNNENMLLDAKQSVDDKVRQAVEKYTTTISQLELQLKAAREKLEEKEAEVAQLSLEVDELKNSSATKESSNQSLQSELDRAEAELAERREEVRTLKDQLRNEASEMVARRRRLDLVMSENQATVCAISDRLTKSDTEVERLQSELEWEKTRLREHRELLTTMRTNSTVAHDQMLNLLQQLDAKKEDIDQLVVDNVVKFDAMKSFFDTKILELNEVAAVQITRLQAERDKTNSYNEQLKQQLAEMTDKLSKAQKMLLQVEEQYDAQEIEVVQLQLSCHQFEKLYKETNKKYEDSIAKLAEQQLAVDKAQSYITEWTNKLEMMQERTIHHKEHNSKIEQEKEKSDKSVAELKAEILTGRNPEVAFSKLFDDRDLLESTLRKVEAEYKELSDKYAAVIGHNNHKQKIQHMLQMKREKLQLKEDVDAARKIIAQQQRTIEKLRSEERNRQLSKEKENLPTVVASPHKPSTPLKDRNV